MLMIFPGDAARHDGRNASAQTEQLTVRRLHLRNVAFLAIALIGGISALYVVHEVQIQRLTVFLIEEAASARAIENYRQAAKRLAEYVRLHPDDVQARIRLVRDQAKSARTDWEYYRVVLDMEELLVRFPDQRELRREAAEMTLDVGRPADAMTHLEILMQSGPEDPDLQLLLGRCYEDVGTPEAAVKIYRDVIDADPDFIPAYERLAGVLGRRHDQDGAAETLFDEMLAANPNVAAAHLAHARFALQRQDHARAFTDAQNAFALAPADKDILCLLADLTSKYHESISDGATSRNPSLDEALQQAIVASPQEPRLYVARGQIQLSTGRVDDAHECLLEGLKACKQKRELELCLADLLIDRRKLDDAADQIDRLRSENADPTLTGFVEARLLMARGDWHAAFRLLMDLRGAARIRTDLLFQVEMHLGKCCQELRHSAWRLAAYRRAVALDPTSLAARLELAAACEQQDELDEAAAIYRALLDRPGVAPELGRVLLRLALRRPADETAWKQLAEILESAAETRSGGPELVLLRAETLAAQDKLPEAAEVLAQGCKDFGAEVALRCACADVVERMGQPQQAEEILDAAENELGLSREIIFERFRILAWRHADDFAKVPQDFAGKLLEAVHLAPAEKRFDLIEACALGCELTDDRELAERLWDEAAKLAPFNIAVKRRQVDLALNASNDDKALASIAELRQIEGKQGVYWRIGTVSRMLKLARTHQKVDLREVRDLMHEVASRLPNAPGVGLTLAEIAELQGDVNTAIEHYRGAIESGARQPEVILRACRLLSQVQRFAEVEQLLEQFAADTKRPMIDEMARLSAEAALWTGNFEQAVARAKAAVPGDTRDFRDYIWLSNLMDATGFPNEAQAALERACELAPAEPAAILALVGWLARHDRTGEAEEFLLKAITDLSEPQAGLTRAQGAALLGRRDVATKMFQAVVESAPDDKSVSFAAADFFSRSANPALAEPLWRKLCEDGDSSWQNEQPTARRGLVTCLLARGSYPTIEEGLELLRLNAEQSGETLADLRLKARLLANHPARSRRKEAVSILIRLSETATLTPDDQFLLARVQLGMGDWPAARAELQSLLANYPNQLDYLSFAVRQILDHEPDPDAVTIWLDRLAQLEPSSFRTLAYRVRWLDAQERFDEARALVHKAVYGDSPATESGAPADKEDWSRDAAALLADEAARLARGEDPSRAEAHWRDAEELYRLCAGRAPKWTSELVQFLARRGRRDEALQLARRSVAECVPEELAFALVNSLQIGKAGPDDYRSVHEIIEASLAASELVSAQVLFSLGNLAQLESRYSEAERMYRRAIEKDSASMLAANNLAYLLAVRGSDLADALELANRSLEMAGPVPSLLDTRAVVYLRLGRHSEALADIEQALADASTPVLQFHRCLALLAGKRREAARIAYHSLVTAGVTASNFHALEQESWRQLENELKIP